MAQPSDLTYRAYRTENADRLRKVSQLWKIRRWTSFVIKMRGCVRRDVMSKWVLLVQGGVVFASPIALRAASEREAPWN